MRRRVASGGSKGRVDVRVMGEAIPAATLFQWEWWYAPLAFHDFWCQVAIAALYAALDKAVAFNLTPMELGGFFRDD
jgi:hypothetical protein